MHDPGKYRGITLLGHVFKLLERILGTIIWARVEEQIGEEQQGFRRGIGISDGMFSLEVEGSMALGFVDLDKADDTVHMELVMSTH